MEKGELDLCSIIKEDSFICTNIQIRHESASSICETSLLHDESKVDCPMQQVKNINTCIRLHHKNKWIYALTSAIHTKAVCKKEITQFTLKGSGLLHFDPECTLKIHIISIQGQQTISSSLSTSYTNLWTITEPTQLTRLNLSFNQIHSKYHKQIQNLTKLQTLLKSQELIQLPRKVETHNYQNKTIGYLALTITCGILIYLTIIRRCKTQPIPGPRNQHTMSNFTVQMDSSQPQMHQNPQNNEK
ncbi:hypothetical protein EVAR_91349_1 [Eumeta japonica]|uniref:Uncharacterized protein n=1 Tax=Eumeta variegata TaxID=151549 RepID=A0A4C1TCX3_EUMVA|nr:hypothetical protein EVAR_91349_1 [Eumeta japonica]